jgi:hypothetical protein
MDEQMPRLMNEEEREVAMAARALSDEEQRHLDLVAATLVAGKSALDWSPEEVVEQWLDVRLELTVKLERKRVDAALKEHAASRGRTA